MLYWADEFDCYCPDAARNLPGSFSGTGNSAESMAGQILQELNNGNRGTDISNMVDTIDRGLQSVAGSINSAVNQLDHIVVSGDRAG